MKHEDIYVGQEVIYINDTMLVGDKSKWEKLENLGVVTSKNDSFIFVRYGDNHGSAATKATDLYSIHNRADLQEKLRALNLNP